MIITIKINRFFRIAAKGLFVVAAVFLINSCSDDDLATATLPTEDDADTNTVFRTKTVPDSINLNDVIRRVRQLTYLKWSPVRYLPGTDGAGPRLGVKTNNSALKVSINDSKMYLSFFGKLFGTDGKYTLTYSGGWRYNDNAVNLTNCGLSFAGAPSDGDELIFTFSMDIPPGNLVFPIGQSVEGAPYSTSYEFRNQIGVNIGIKTFLTALYNPNSLLYRISIKDCDISSYGKRYGATYYGGVCTGFNTAVYGLGKYCNMFQNMNDGEWIDLNMIKLNIESPEDVKNVQIGDCILLRNGNAAGHSLIVSTVRKDSLGEIVLIETTEWINPKVHRRKFNAESFYDKWINPETSTYFSDRYIFRYKETFVSDSLDNEDLFFKDVENIKPNKDVAIDKGEESWYSVDENLQITIFNDDYKNAVLYYQNGTSWTIAKTIYTSNFVRGYGETKVFDIELKSLAPGEYRLRLEGPQNSEYAYFSLVDFGNINVAGNTVTFNGYSSNIKPVAVLWVDESNYFQSEYCRDLQEYEIAKGRAELHEPPEKITYPYAVISFKFAYGYCYSNPVVR